MLGLIIAGAGIGASKMIEHRKKKKEERKRREEIVGGRKLDSEPLPVFFWSHGGPSFMDPDAEFGGNPGAYKKVQEIGNYVRGNGVVKFIIIVSGHWESEALNSIEVAVPTQSSPVQKSPDSPPSYEEATKTTLENSLIYDFYNFPARYYQEQFHSRCDVDVANKIVERINRSESDLNARSVSRGLDHGAWVPLKVAFPRGKTDDYWNLDVPVIQVSLPAGESFSKSYELGRILASFRTMGGLIIGSGMSVHNLSDLRSFTPGAAPRSYVSQFNKLIKNIISSPREKGSKLAQFEKIKRDSDSNKLLHAAHPSLDHFLPLLVSLGAGEGISSPSQFCARELYNYNDYSMGWGLYEFGV
ncbi:LAMI_0B05270g1_1 [Lachancea mirantina]|uniref:LAMI_0B05270g1_1 n=1 Tax=Lachancea mirantina TaxID=1230905 RepID=A0A1G4IWE1_9SACH|nr:LAMI_0B05270g1_1 [Lachancea mirantina]